MSSANESFRQRFLRPDYIGIGFMFMIALGFVAALCIGIHRGLQQEIDVAKYQQLSLWCEADAEFRKAVQPYLADGKITMEEYDQIQRLAGAMQKRRLENVMKEDERK